MIQYVGENIPEIASESRVVATLLGARSRHRRDQGLL